MVYEIIIFRNFFFCYMYQTHILPVGPQEALDNLQIKIGEAKKNWEANTTVIHGKAKQVLLELGLNPLYI
jgi:hypothetical protein